MELLLPVALKLFPNMLPSTFEDKFAAVRRDAFRMINICLTLGVPGLTGGKAAEVIAGQT